MARSTRINYRELVLAIFPDAKEEANQTEDALYPCVIHEGSLNDVPLGLGATWEEAWEDAFDYMRRDTQFPLHWSEVRLGNPIRSGNPRGKRKGCSRKL
jgi:hypothetical protein